MPVVDESQGSTAGVYVAVWERQRQEVARHMGAVPRVWRDRLEAFAAGLPVDVPAYYLPDGVRPRSRAGWPGWRAVVAADDAVSQVRVETPGEWLAEHELFVEYLPVVGLGRPKKDAEIPADLREFRSTSTTRSAPRASPLNPAWGRQA